MMTPLNANEIAELENLTGYFCPGCGDRLRRRDIDGGRCVACGDMLCSLTISEQPCWNVSTVQHGQFTMRAENERAIKSVMRSKKIVVITVVRAVGNQTRKDDPINRSEKKS